jgi:catechol 2,3-dioxygenase-like lactoylglutathione lyase family enzyme
MVLTVTDPERSAQWWTEVLRFKVILKIEKPGFREWSILHPSGVSVGLLAHDEAASDRFDERAVGLDHVALNVADRSTLEKWARHLDRLGVTHSGIKEENGGPLITLRDPDNIQLELHAFDPKLVVL